MGRDFNKSSVPPCSHWQQQAFKNVNGASLQRQWWALLAKIPRIKVLVSVFLVLWMEWRCICLVIDSEAFQKSKGGNKLELLCSIRVKTRQAYCVLRTNSKPWASGTHGITTKYWSKRTKRPGIRMSDFMKPILGTGRHRLFTFFMEGCFQWEISLFPPLLVSTPQTYQDHCCSIFHEVFCCAILVLAPEIHNPLLVSGSATLRRGIPLLSPVVFEMNEFVQSAQVWIQRLIFPWRAATTRVPKHNEPFIPASTEAGGWHPPGYLRAEGAASSSSLLLLPLNSDGAVRVLIIYWFYPKGYTTYHQLCFAGWETSKHH